MANVLVLDRHIPRASSTLGGGDRYLEHLSAALMDEGHVVHVGVNLEPTYEVFVSRLRDSGVIIHPVDIGSAPLEDAYGGLLEDLAPDLVHVRYHGSCMTTAIVHMSAFRDPGFKRTVTMHLPLPSVAHAAENELSLRERMPFSWYWRASRQDRRFLTLFDKVICVSRRHASVLVDVGLLPAHVVEVIPNGVDIERFSPAPGPRTASDTLVVGAVGNLCAQKRFDVLIDAVAAVSGTRPVKLLIAGEGPDESALRDRAERSDLGGIVEFVGFREDIIEFLRSLDVFAMTSDEEGSPYAALEAMAVGLPVVATAVGDLPDFVRDGVDGFIVPRGDVPAIADKLALLTERPDLPGSMGARARARIESEYSHATWRTRTVEAFQSLLPLPLRPVGSDRPL